MIILNCCKLPSEETLISEVVGRVKERELTELYWWLRKSPEWKPRRDPEVFKKS